MLSPEQLFRRSAKNEIPASLIIQGDDAYLVREWKKLLAKANFEITEIDLKKKSPELSMEDLGSGLSLFRAKTLLWFRNPAALSQWKSESKKLWERMKSRADGESSFLVLQTPIDKRLKWDALNGEEECRFEVPADKKMLWIGRMNEHRQAELTPEKMRFLALLEDDLLILDNWIELWALGGDTWAEKSIGWGAEQKAGARPAHLAFAWVDAIVSGDRSNSIRYLKMLEDDSQEPLQLLGLLTKSVRILSALDLGLDVSRQAPFLVDKLRSKKNRAHKLLKMCTQIDWELKSSATDKFAALSRL